MSSFCLQLTVPQLRLFRGHFLVKHAAAGFAIMEMEDHDGHDGLLSKLSRHQDGGQFKVLTERDIDRLGRTVSPFSIPKESRGGQMVNDQCGYFGDVSL